MNTVTLPVKGLNFAGCAREIEKHLGKLAPIAHVEASYVSQTVTVTYDETRLDEEQHPSPDSQDLAALFHNQRKRKRLVPIGLWYFPRWKIVRRLRPPRRWIWVSWITA
ncbi:MAG: heavy-metal-associated domain-containing protein [Chloroflexi bacterium]|nr:MAG: heavy-metal-associated domain-containing protein [Chloroflexota bacterium]